MSSSHHFEGLQVCHLQLQLVLDCLILKMKLQWPYEILEITMQWQSVMFQLKSYTSTFHYKQMSWQTNNSLGKICIKVSDNYWVCLLTLIGRLTLLTSDSAKFELGDCASCTQMVYQWAVPQVTFCWTSFISVRMSHICMLLLKSSSNIKSYLCNKWNVTIFTLRFIYVWCLHFIQDKTLLCSN
jgi:hypothetical protein